jgi:predicted nucleic acid-binding protein
LLIRLESEAKLFIQSEILKGTFELIWSYMLDYENAANPYEDRKRAIKKWRAIATLDVDASDEVLALGKEIMHRGTKKKDALHIACAVKANCHYFLTTDKKILRTVFKKITVINPLDFIKILEV